MTDDIVTRLRDKASQIRCVVGVNTSVIIPMLELEAADEIERLRKIINRWETCKVVYDNLCEPDEMCKACKELAEN
jgi:hypothetical protein